VNENDLALVENLVVVGVALTARALAGGGGVDLTFPQWRVIVVLGETPYGATLTEISNRIGVTLPATGRQIRRLERKNLVQLEKDTTDRRATRARLSAEGKRARIRILEYRRLAIARALVNVEVDSAGRDQLARLEVALAESA
jgi:DNA-binding MarR family transcriptional regulator